MTESKEMNMGKRFLGFCLQVTVTIWLLVFLTSCSAAVPLPTTPTGAVMATATDRTLRQEVPSPTPQTCTVRTGVSSGYLNLRMGAGTQYAVVRVLKDGEILTVTKPGAWLEVSDQHGNRGYVNSNYCK